MNIAGRTTAVFLAAVFLCRGAAAERRVIHLTLDSSAEIAMGRSYRIKQLEMGIERSRYWLKARRASLKSRVYMNLRAPEYKAVSDYKWNSTLRKDEIVRQNTRLWRMDLAVRQPVILFGRPTNGYLSLNNRTYKYLQMDGTDEVNYYNRYYLKFEQPFFLPNELKNDLEDAELDLEDSELNYVRNRVALLERVADDYFDLFEYTYRNTIYERQLETLEKIADSARALALEDTTRRMDEVQVRVEIANVRNAMLQNQVSMRRQEAETKQRLRLSVEDSVYVTPTFDFKPVEVDFERALEYAYTLRPTMRMLNIDRRKNEIDLSNAEAWDAFHVNLEVTYGLEKEDERYQQMWENYDNSYSASLNAYVPIWDWGRRKARIEAERIGVSQTDLRIEEEKNSIRSEITVALENMREYRERTKNLMESVKMAEEMLGDAVGRYGAGLISIQDLLQIVERRSDTESNFLAAYMGYRRSLNGLMLATYYDFENDISLLEKYKPRD